MFKRFFPSARVKSFRDADYEALYAQGVRGLIFDIDNTIEGYGAATPSRENADFLMSLTDMGFNVCFVSNNNLERVSLFNRELGFPALSKAGKPARKAVYRAAALMGFAGRTEALALIGDQVFTDIWCGNRCGVYTVLVEPVTGIDPWTVSLKRMPERWIINRYKKITE